MGIVQHKAFVVHTWETMRGWARALPGIIGSHCASTGACMPPLLGHLGPQCEVHGVAPHLLKLPGRRVADGVYLAAAAAHHHRQAALARHQHIHVYPHCEGREGVHWDWREELLACAAKFACELSHGRPAMAVRHPDWEPRRPPQPHAREPSSAGRQLVMRSCTE